MEKKNPHTHTVHLMTTMIFHFPSYDFFSVQKESKADPKKIEKIEAMKNLVLHLVAQLV